MPADAAEARGRVRVLLDRVRGAAPAAARDPVVADALLVTSELVTNALRHAGGLTGFEAAYERTPDGMGLRLVVEDASADLPTARVKEDDFAPGGYGWPMVCRLASSVSVSALPSGGKRIQVLLALG
ncbi:ATP-binding protein [Streptomyces sp. NPDC059070]|uniref:ATP-binding protein n=1 Tax=Streptomyces sp. NPDC059070 TaxID=3346713 RepID=UPI00367EA43A